MLKIGSGKEVKNNILVRMNSKIISKSTEKLQAGLISRKSKKVQMRTLWKTLALSLELRGNIHTGAYFISAIFVLFPHRLVEERRNGFVFVLIILSYFFALPGSKISTTNKRT